MASPGDLRAKAALAAANAYAPYSGLHVGASVLANSGKIYSGCNVENGALPIGGCAERAAIAAGVLAEGASFGIAAIAVVARSEDMFMPSVSPCGACRQAIIEFGARAEVQFLAQDGTWTIEVASDLLPHGFVLPSG
ncbi:cytidine deaminase [Arenimonas alkanexedens]